MYKASFGTKKQITFNSESEYYEFLGFLAKGNGSTRIVWEDNDHQGAWGKEGRIEFLISPPVGLRANLEHTAGTGNIQSRVNCNEFVENLVTKQGFVFGPKQDHLKIVATIPNSYLAEFNVGLNL